MGDTNEINMGDHAQANQVAAGNNITQIYFESARREFDARFSLPTPPRDFTGRADEIETLVNALTQGQGAAISGLSGMGGIGKSALAQIVAQRVAEKFPDAQIWIDLRGLDKEPTKPSEAMRQVILAFEPDAGASIKDANDAQLAQIYRSVLHGKHALLVLDNARDNAQIRPLLQTDAAFLVTSRLTLTEGGLQSLHLGVMKPDDAKNYLVQLCPRLQGRKNEIQQVRELCGDLPLALKIAGSYLGVTPNIEIARYIEKLRARRLEILRERGDDELNVEAAFALTYDQLPPTMQLTWRLLAVFPAPFWDTAAAYVWGVEEGQAEDELGELVRYSLVEYSAEDPSTVAQGKYRLHDLLREFALTRLSADEKWQAEKHHAEFYVQVARQADELYLKGNENVVAGLKLFEQELPHIRAGQEWAVANMECDRDAAEICSKYPLPNRHAAVLSLRLSVREQIAWIEKALIAARKLGDRQSEGIHLCNLGVANRDLDNVRKSIELYGKALEIYREIGYKQGESVVLGNLGAAYQSLGEVPKAIKFYKQNLAIAREIGDRRGEGIVLGNLGLAYAESRNAKKAIGFYKQALVISLEINDQRGLAIVLGYLGHAYWASGETGKAIGYYEQSISIARKIADQRQEGSLLIGLGLAYSYLGEVQKAIQYFEQALPIMRKIGSQRGHGITLANMGLAYKKLGDTKRALQLWRAALEIFEVIEHPNAERVRKWLEVNEE